MLLNWDDNAMASLNRRIIFAICACIVAIAVGIMCTGQSFDAMPSLASGKTKHDPPAAIDMTLHWLGANVLRPALAAFARRSHGPLPQISGDLDVAGLRDRVKVVRDKHGVPHIDATSLHDATLAQGYVHCQDRLWQLNTNRLLARGRLSKYFGLDALGTDKLARVLGFARLGEADWDRLARRSFAEHLIATKALRCTATAVRVWPGLHISLSLRASFATF